jgi:glycerol uptake facilitator-like aquaporin
MIYIGGSVSGGNFNPAVTATLIAIGEMEVTKGLIWMVAQCVGSVLGALAVELLIADSSIDDSIHYPNMETSNFKPFKGFVAEFFATFFLVYAVVSGIRLGKNELIIGTWVGMSLCFAINSIGGVTGAALNPCRRLGPALIGGKSFNKGWWVFYAGTFGGGLTAGLLANFVTHPKSSQQRAAGYESRK